MATLKPRHSDLNPAFGEPGANAILYGEEAVKSAIRCFLASPVGARSRSFQQLWGCDLIRMIQEPFGSSTAQMIRAMIISSLARFEPRIEVLSASSVVPDPSRASYKVTLVYRLSGIDHVRSYSFFLDASNQSGAN